MTLCGHIHTGIGFVPLRCNLERGHAGPHGIRLAPDLPPYVFWVAR